jgi:hypothetical protein
MVTTFNTNTPSGTSSSSNALLYLLGAAIVGYGLYKFVYIPMRDKKIAEQDAVK